MQSLGKYCQKAENVLLVITFTVMVAAFFLQVMNRNFFKLSMPYLEEVAVFSMIYMIMFGTEAGLRDGSQIAVTALQDRLGTRVRLVVQIAVRLIIVLFSAIVCVSSLTLVRRQLASGQKSPALQIPMAIPYMGITIPFGVIVIVQSITAIQLMRRAPHGLPSRDLPSDEAGEE